MANDVAKKISSNESIVVPGTQKIDKVPPSTELRYFRKNEKDEAMQIASRITEAGLKAIAKYVPGYESSDKIRPRHYELWISKS